MKKYLSLIGLIALTASAQVVSPQTSITVTLPPTVSLVTNLVAVTNPPTVSIVPNVVAITNAATTTNMTVQDLIQQAQSPVRQGQLGGVPAFIQNALANIDESTNLFLPGEVEFRIGGVYVQKTGEGGTLLSVEKWDVLIPNLGIGAEGITSGQNQAAEFGYAAYRHTIGNVAGALLVGFGYSDIDKKLLGVVGGRVEYRSSKHLGEWVSISYGIEAHEKNARGSVIGGGISYSF